MNESEELDDLENQILAIIGEVSVNGHPNTNEPIVCFDGYNEVRLGTPPPLTETR